MESLYRKRIGFSGDLKKLSKIICRDFNIGAFKACKISALGYEDFNFSLATVKGKYFVKIFSNTRAAGDCKRNVDVITKSIDAGVSVPKLYQSEQGFLHTLTMGKTTLRLCVMDSIDGEDLYTSRAPISHKDIGSLARQASLINSIDTKPSVIYDSWAINNFPKEYEKKKQYLDREDLALIAPLIIAFKNLKIESLPHCFVHGDFIRTNIIKDRTDKLWVVDFSVSNYYPRIQELAVLACDVLFNKEDIHASEHNLKIALAEYQKIIPLTPRELASLPTYIKLAHAMHLLCANYERKVNKNNSEENKYFYALGKSGLKQMDS